jgi:hypothetical protein
VVVWLGVVVGLEVDFAPGPELFEGDEFEGDEFEGDEFEFEGEGDEFEFEGEGIFEELFAPGDEDGD